MSVEKTIVVDTTLVGQTLAAVLRKVLGNLSWTNARQLIASRSIRVNGVLCLDDARRLKAGETVEVNKQLSSSAPAERDARIVYCDSDIAVVEKPAGLQTVRRIEERDWSDERKKRQPVLLEVVETLLEKTRTSTAAKSPGARKAFARQRPKSLPKIRVRPVHRLDRDTSGLILFALSAAAETELIRRFANHDIRRVYKAVVLGNLRGRKTIETHILRDRGDGIRGSVPEGATSVLGQRAVTHVRPIEHIGNDFTIVECQLETGRTHQIRIHLAELGHPLCGEKVYLKSRPDGPIFIDKSDTPRQALHSAELEFAHPTTGKQIRFESPWPADLVRWMLGLSGMGPKELKQG